MPETLVELVARISADASELKKGLSDAERKTEQSSKKMADSLKKVGMAMAASGAAIVAAMGFMGKAAIDEEINIKRLATTMGNVGVEYDKVKDSLEAVISTTQRKTGVADNEQRDILNRLILVTNDYNKALELLPITLDLAAAGGMDATTAATYLGKAFLELEDGAEEVSVRFGQASLQFKSMEDIQNRVAGAAENLVNPLNVLKASIGDVAETIGANLVPIIKGLTDKIVDVAIKVQEWAKEHPELARNITLVVTGLGILLTVVGGLILILPGLIAGIAAFGVVFHAALGPIGLISIAITALIAGGIALWRNWDKVSHFFLDIWSNMKNAVLHAVDYMLKSLQNFIGWIPFFGDKITEARDKIANMIEAEKVKRDIRDVQEELKELQEVTAETTETTNGLTESLDPNLVDAMAEVEERTKALQDEEAKLQEQFSGLMRELQFNETAAGKLNLRMGDVYTAMYKLGYKTEQIADVFRRYGNITEIDEALLNDLGLTAEDVAKLVGKLKEETDKGTESFKKYGDEAEKAAEKVAQSWGTSLAEIAASKSLPSGEGRLSLGEYIGSREGTAEVYGRMAEGGISKREAISDMQKEVYGFGLPGYKEGGYVNETGLAYLHAGEKVIPANEGMGTVVNNYFTQPVFFDREDTMNRFVDKIRKGIQRQDRLRFGGAYSG